MQLAILLSLAACLCTATGSVCQRLGATNLEQSSAKDGGFDPWLVFRLARQSAWLLGFACMVGGFVLQVAALHFGPLALVQPILALELLFVFGWLALLPGPRGVSTSRGDWLAVVAMTAGIAVFLRSASPSGGRSYAPAGLWWLAAGAAVAAVAVAIALSGTISGSVASSPRRAAWLGIATGIAWGFVAAVIKELSSRVTGGPAAIFGNWSVYALMVAGAAAMLLTSHAMAAGPLAASQPGFTILDPVTATLLGVVLYDEHLAISPAALAGELLSLVVLAVGARSLSHSRLISGQERPMTGSTNGSRSGVRACRKS
ncbi:MAG: DMT family transporter [Trebonia sp.]|jgi:drug/metabolite transporter (DMT)-like permease